jgi:hypothetical protein
MQLIGLCYESSYIIGQFVGSTAMAELLTSGVAGWGPFTVTFFPLTRDGPMRSSSCGTR